MLTELDKRMNEAEYALQSMRYKKKNTFQDIKLLSDNGIVARVIDSAGNVFEFKCIHHELIGRKIDTEKLEPISNVSFVPKCEKKEEKKISIKKNNFLF